MVMAELSAKLEGCAVQDFGSRAGLFMYVNIQVLANM